MTKFAIVQAIISAVEAELASCQAAAREASKAATDPDSKAENKYDTRNLEASYIARGQAMRLQELTQALDDYRAMLGATDLVRVKVQLGSLVLLEAEDEDLFFYVGPSMGGLEVTVERQMVAVLTASSPLGSLLMGQKVGFSCSIGGKSPAHRREILSIE